MKLTAQDRSEIVEVLSEIHRDWSAARGLFRLSVSGKSFEMPVENYEWEPVPGVAGVQMCALPVAHWPQNPLPNADYFLSRGPKDAEQQLLEIPQAVVNEVLEGLLYFWKATAPAYTPYGPGDVFSLQPKEPHGWRAASDFRCRVAFTPRITQP